MLYVTASCVVEQEGVADFFVSSDDLQTIISNINIREDVLRYLKKDAILIDFTEEPMDISFDLSRAVSPKGAKYLSILKSLE